MQIVSLLLYCWIILADCWNHLENVQMLTIIVKKPMEIIEKNNYYWHFNCLWKRLNWLVKSKWKKVYTYNFKPFIIHHCILVVNGNKEGIPKMVSSYVCFVTSNFHMHISYPSTIVPSSVPCNCSIVGITTSNAFLYKMQMFQSNKCVL